MSQSLLVVHHVRETADRIQSVLREAGLGHRGCEDLLAAFELVRDEQPDLVLLGWHSGETTEDALRRIKSTGHTRVILLASNGQLPQAVQWMEQGADDCISEAAASEEVVSRIRAALARPPVVVEHERIAIGPIVLDKAAHSVRVHGQLVDLAPTEYRLMAFFMEHPGRVYSRRQLLDKAWANNIQAGHRTVDVHVRRLRQILEPFGCEYLIQTVRGFGYRFSLPAERDLQEPDASVRSATISIS